MHIMSGTVFNSGAIISVPFRKIYGKVFGANDTTFTRWSYVLTKKCLLLPGVSTVFLEPKWKTHKVNEST